MIDELSEFACNILQRTSRAFGSFFRLPFVCLPIPSPRRLSPICLIACVGAGGLSVVLNWGRCSSFRQATGSNVTLLLDAGYIAGLRWPTIVETPSGADNARLASEGGTA